MPRAPEATDGVTRHGVEEEPGRTQAAVLTAAFLLTCTGALLVGIGSLAVWLTVGIPDEPKHTSFVGVDLVDGRVALVLATAILIFVTITRLQLRPRMRRIVCLTCIGLGTATITVAAVFGILGAERSWVVGAVGIPEALWPTFGVFRQIGVGVTTVAAGGSLAVVGAGLMYRNIPDAPRDVVVRARFDA